MVEDWDDPLHCHSAPPSCSSVVGIGICGPGCPCSSGIIEIVRQKKPRKFEALRPLLASLPGCLHQTYTVHRTEIRQARTCDSTRQNGPGPAVFGKAPHGKFLTANRVLSIDLVTLPFFHPTPVFPSHTPPPGLNTSIDEPHHPLSLPPDSRLSEQPGLWKNSFLPQEISLHKFQPTSRQHPRGIRTAINAHSPA